MTIINSTYVHTAAAVLAYNYLSGDTDKKKGTVSYHVTIAVKKDGPIFKELEQAADAAIAKKYPTGKPFGFKDWWKPINPQKFPELAADHVFVKVSTRDMGKPAYIQGEKKSTEEFMARAYQGAMASVYCQAGVYMPGEQTEGATGAKFYLEGVMLTDLTTPKLSVAPGATEAEVDSIFGAQPSAGSVFTSAPSAAPVAQAPAPAPATPPAAPTPVAPNPGIVPPVPTAKMTAAGQTVESFQAAGWTVEQMRAEGWVI